jgi:hypothetical protein
VAGIVGTTGVAHIDVAAIARRAGRVTEIEGFEANVQGMWAREATRHRWVSHYKYSAARGCIGVRMSAPRQNTTATITTFGSRRANPIDGTGSISNEPTGVSTAAPAGPDITRHAWCWT